MHVIILAAGQSQRFKDAGYEIPKPFLPIEWRGRTMPMVSHVLHSVPRYVRHISIVAQEKDTELAYSAMKHLAPTRTTFDSVKHSHGPAYSAWASIINMPYEESTLILDSDVINHTNDLVELSSWNFPGVLVHRSENPACSYVDSLESFSTIKEKERISDYAVCGAYFIPRYFIPMFTGYLQLVINDYPEPFLSHVFDRLEITRYAIETTYEPVDWGTPTAVQESGAVICT